MFVCQNHGVRSGLFFSQLESRDVFVSCTVRNNAVELTVSAFLELNDVDNDIFNDGKVTEYTWDLFQIQPLSKKGPNQ